MTLSSDSLRRGTLTAMKLVASKSKCCNAPVERGDLARHGTRAVVCTVCGGIVRKRP